MSDIKPMMVNGVGMCCAECPAGEHDAVSEETRCPFDDWWRAWALPVEDDVRQLGEVCLVWARRMAVENEAFESGRMLLIRVNTDSGFVSMFAVADMIGRSPFPTIEAAVDALMAEREE